MALELAEKGNLFDLIFENGQMNEMTALRYFKQIVAGLAHMNSKNLCHRDLKPENILIDSEDNIKIADFGVSCWLTKEANSRMTIAGSPYMMAPEII